MIRVDYQRTDLLFTKYDLHASLDAGRKALAGDADRVGISADSTDQDLDVAARDLADKHSVIVPEFLEDDIFTTSERRHLDVSQDFNRAIFDRSQPSMRDFEAIVFHVPFTGERQLLDMRASTFSLNPPRAEVAQGEIRIVLLVEGEVTPDEVRAVFDRELAGIREALGWVAADVGQEYDSRLYAEARSALEAKRNRLGSTRGLLDGLGFKSSPAGTTQQAKLQTRPVGGNRDPEDPPSSAVPERGFDYDFFISHASEDKGAIARPLYEALVDRGYRVWFDEAELHVGDSLLDKIDEGLANCRFGVVVMSPRFFEKKWTQDELRGLRSRQMNEGPGIILPIWNDVDADFLNAIHPSLAQIKAANFADGIDAVVAEIERVYRR